jgi:hypothetical protein
MPYKSKEKQKKNKRNAEWYQNNKEQKKKTSAEWYQNNKEHANKVSKEWYQNNKEHAAKVSKEWRLKNKEKDKNDQAKWRLENKEWRRNYEKNRYKTDINFRLTKLCRGRIRKIIKGENKSVSTMKLIGCTPDELRQHLESKFEPWMNWENQGLGGWDVEHIIPMSKFNLICPVQQHACCHYSNLQPMEHIANIKKGNK